MSYKKNGFTLIEILISVAIIALISGITITGNREFTSQTLLNNAATDLAFSIRLSQSFSRSNSLTTGRLPLILAFKFDDEHRDDSDHPPIVRNYELFTPKTNAITAGGRSDALDEGGLIEAFSLPFSLPMDRDSVNAVINAYNNLDTSKISINETWNVESGSKKRVDVSIVNICSTQNNIKECVYKDNNQVDDIICPTINSVRTYNNQQISSVDGSISVYMTILPPENSFTHYLYEYINSMGNTRDRMHSSQEIEEVLFCLGTGIDEQQVPVRVINASGQVVIGR